MRPLEELCDRAVARHVAELDGLRFLPESRYDPAEFHDCGQYDWLSGQLLYCLVREFAPVRVIEVSTASGYSSLFSALALKKNGRGLLETFEQDPESARSALRNFERFGVARSVHLHVGDARETATDLLEARRGQHEREILFLDSEHTSEFARFYMDAFLQDTNAESLFHMHDVLPPDAAVMVRPRDGMRRPSFRPRAWAYRFLRKLQPKWVPFHMRRWVRPVVMDPTQWTSEGQVAHTLSARVPAEHQLYVHDIVDRYPTLDAYRYATTSMWRCDSRGKPMEWNESWWCRCGPLRLALLA